MLGIATHLSQLLGRGEKSETPDSNADSNASEQAEEVPTTLYVCSECDVTYISIEMESCSNCGGTVEPTPDEYDLGILSQAARP